MLPWGKGTLTPPIATLLLLLALGLQFQIVVPLGIAELKICPADMIALILAVLLAYSRIQKPNQAWLLGPTVPYWFLACLAVLIASSIIGYTRMGTLSSWAFGNKLLGWGVLGTWLAAGLYSGSCLGDTGRRQLSRFLVYSSVFTGLAAASLSLVLAHTNLFPSSLAHFPVQGFVDNRNAFIFLQSAAMIILLAQGWARIPFFSAREREILCGLCAATLVYSSSRSGLPAIALILAVALALRAITFRTLLRSLCYAVACGLSLEAARSLILSSIQFYSSFQVGTMAADLPPLFNNAPALILSDTTAGSSDLQRLSSIRDAIDLWLSAPIFGAGLGTALQHSATRYDSPLIIHNTALWLLAETGVVGLAIFMKLGWAMARPLFPLRRDDPDACFRLAGVLMLIMFAIMSLVHEMLYQRVLWLMLGVALAVPATKADKACVD